MKNIFRPSVIIFLLTLLVGLFNIPAGDNLLTSSVPVFIAAAVTGIIIELVLKFIKKK